FLLFVYILTGHSVSSAVGTNPKFTHFGVEDGLPSRTIWTLLVDDKNSIWLGTGNGLVQYNGADFRVFRNASNEVGSNNSNIVRSIYVDEQSSLIVGTWSGLSRINDSSKSLETIPILLPTGKKLEELAVFSIIQSRKGIYWLGTNEGLVGVNHDLTSVVYQSSSSKNNNSYNKTRINSILEIDEELLLGTNDGLLKFDTNTLKLSPFDNQHSQLIVQTLFQQNNERILAGTSNGLYSIDYSNKVQTQILEDRIRDFVYSITETDKENVWVATRNQGLFRLSGDNSIVNNLVYSKDDIHSLSDYDAYSLTRDLTGGLWIGTFNAGLNFLNLDSSNFKRLFDSSSSLNCLKSPVIYSILEDKKERIWLGTQQGLVRFNSSEQECFLLESTKSKTNSLSYSEVRTVFMHPENPDELVINTKFGTDIVNMNSLEVSKPDLQFPETYIFDGYHTQDGSYFLITTSGVFKKNNSENTFTLLQYQDSGYSGTRTTSLNYTSNGEGYVGSVKGLFVIDEQERLKKVNWGGADETSKAIRALHIDSKDNIWLGIDNYALSVFQPNGNLIASFQDAETLPAINGFSSILEDSHGAIWVSGINGISRVSLAPKEITNFHSEDGLQGENFTNGAKYISEKGEVFFGSRKGLTSFFPKRVKDNQIPPNVVLSNFYYFNEILNFGESNNGFTLPSPTSRLEEITLSHRDYVFGFEFSAQHYADPKRNKYAFMLENWDEDWNYTDAKFRRASYSNLPPGDYVFKVKASNNHGIWNHTPRTVKIHVKPAPWASPTAYLIYAITFILAVFGFIKYRTSALQKRASDLENTVNNRTKELATEKEKVEQLLSRKNEEFANVSHEFRTPLTLILGPVKQLKAWTQEDKYNNKLNIIQRNSLRLLRMVDQLLNLETFRVKAITQKSPQAIGKIIQLVAEAFADLAKDKKLSFEISQIDSVCFDFTPDATEKIVVNLLSNAIKYTKSGGAITISAVRDKDNQYHIRVSDSGIGIAEDKLSNVFERFNRVMDENSEQVTGSGIGLALVKSLVESHSGSVKLESELSVGTTISVTLPIINEVDESEISVHQNDEIIAMELMNFSRNSPDKNALVKSTELNLSSDKPTILIIEDNDDMRQYIEESISQQFNTLVAANGQVGLELAIQEVPDLIISDIMMPKLDGYETTKALRETQVTNHIPVVLLTARGDRDSRLKGWQEKADEYITKPFDVEELIIRISNLIEIRNILKRRFSESVFEESSHTEAKVVESIESDKLSIVESNTQRLQLEFIEQLNENIELVYMEAELSVSDIASSVNMGERQFYRKLRSIVDMTPNEYLRRFRLEKSKEILRAGKSASYTAFEVGFSSQNYFSKCFKAQYSMTPTQFVNQK
ncbi:MAG: ATP-binding protein, partial [Kangiellaceae bacterium]